MGIKVQIRLASVWALVSGAVFAGAGDYLVPMDGAWGSPVSFSNATDHAIGDIPPRELGPWQQGAVLQARGVNVQNGGAWATNEVYQVDWVTGRRILAVGDGGQIRLGAGGIVSHTWQNGPIRLLSPNADPPGELRLVADQTWHNNGEPNASLTVSTDQDQAGNTMRVVADPGVTLTLRDKVTLNVGADTEFGGDIVVMDSSRVTLDKGRTLKAGCVTLVGPNSKAVFHDAVSLFANRLVLSQGASFVAEGQTWDIDAPLSVVGGESTLSGFLMVSGERLEVDVAAGATLVVSALPIGEASGEPVEVVNLGEGTMDVRSVNVGSTPCAPGTLVVGQGQTLNVCGGGLTAATTVELSGGTLRASAEAVTIASPIVVTAKTAAITNSIEVALGCEARFAGGLVHEGTVATPLILKGAGTKTFVSDITFRNGCHFRHTDGDVVVSNSVWTLNGADSGHWCNSVVAASAGRFLFGENAKLTGQWFDVSVSVDKGNADGGILEFGEGSELYLPGTGKVRVATTAEGRGTLRVSGGYLHARYAQGFVEICSHSYASQARLEFLSGVIECVSPIKSTHQPYDPRYAHAVLDWRGGTLRANRTESFSTYIRTFLSGGGVNAMEVTIDGPDCVLDVGHPSLDEISLYEDKDAAGCGMRWTCTERGVLTLTNSTSRAGRLVVHNAFTNMNLRVCANAGLRVDDRTQVYPFSISTLEKGGEGALDGIALCDGLEKAVRTVKGGAGVVFSKADLAGWSYTDLAFADGAIYAFAVNGASTDTLTIPGRLVLPATMALKAEADPALVSSSSAIFTAAQGIEGDCTFTLAPGSRQVRCEIVGSSLDRVVRGLAVVVR